MTPPRRARGHRRAVDHVSRSSALADREIRLRADARADPRLRRREPRKGDRNAPTILPGRSDSTTSLLARNTASSMSWVMRRAVFSELAQSSSRTRCRSSRVSASRAPSGSSRRSTAGSAASARAKPTRCCIPPDSVHTGWPANSARPDPRDERPDHAPPMATLDAAELQRESDVLGNVEPGEERVALEDDGAVNRWPFDRLAAKETSPELGRISPAKALRSVVLPEPDGPSTARNAPGSTARSIDRRGRQRPARRHRRPTDRGPRVQRFVSSRSPPGESVGPACARQAELSPAGLVRRRCLLDVVGGDIRPVVGEHVRDLALFLQEVRRGDDRLDGVAAEERGEACSASVGKP